MDYYSIPEENRKARASANIHAGMNVGILAMFGLNLILRKKNKGRPDMLTTVLLAAACPILACPAMNPRMWANPLVRENVEKLRATGWLFLEPGEGTVACGHTGQGRMREPSEIHAGIDALLAERRPAGKKPKRKGK